MIWGVTKVELHNELPFHYSELNPFKSMAEVTYAPREEVTAPHTAAVPEKGDADVWLETVYREKEEELTKKEKPQKTYRFFVIGGCFADYDNADRLIRRLKRKGFDAQLVGKNKRNLHRVAYSGYSTRREAKRALLKIKKEQMSSAWLFVKR
jgi:cell division protein FtsN